jgi:hypothetical protein
MTTPDLHLRTAFVFDDRGRMLHTREPTPQRAPAFTIVRGRSTCVWAVRADVHDHVADELDRLARDEPPAIDWQQAPRHADRYLALLGGRPRSGPAFTFPDAIDASGGVVAIDDIRQLERHLTGWTADEIPGREPIVAILDDGHAVSVCCCARLSDEAAEAGLETAAAYRGRGYGRRVTVAWAHALRASGRAPLYSTSWDNAASLAVARKLRLEIYACDWAVGD